MSLLEHVDRVHDDGTILRVHMKDGTWFAAHASELGPELHGQLKALPGYAFGVVGVPAGGGDPTNAPLLADATPIVDNGQIPDEPITPADQAFGQSVRDRLASEGLSGAAGDGELPEPEISGSGPYDAASPGGDVGNLLAPEQTGPVGASGAGAAPVPGDVPGGVPGVTGDITAQQQAAYDAALKAGASPEDAIKAATDLPSDQVLQQKMAVWSPEQKRAYQNTLDSGGSSAQALSVADSLSGPPAADDVRPKIPGQGSQPGLSGASFPDLPAPPNLETGTTPEEELEEGRRTQNEAIQRMADVEAGYYHTKSLIEDHLQNELNARIALHDRQRAANDAAGADLAQQVANFKIDPYRIFHDPENGQAALAVASIASAFGAFGATLGHTQNFAQENINRIVQTDAEAQYRDLDKKQSMLRYYMERGHDLDSALTLTKANLLDVAQAQIGRAASQMGADTAVPNMQKLKGALEMDAAQKRSALQSAQDQRALLQYQARREQYTMQLNRAVYQEMFGGAGGGSDPVEQGIMMNVLHGEPEKFNEHVVYEARPLTDSDGVVRGNQRTMRLATSPENAKAATEQFQGLREQSDRLRRLEEFHRAHPDGSWSPTDQKAGLVLAKQFALALPKTQVDINRYTSEEGKVANEIVGDPTGVFQNLFTNQGGVTLGLLRSGLEHQYDAIEDARLTPHFRKVINPAP